MREIVVRYIKRGADLIRRQESNIWGCEALIIFIIGGNGGFSCVRMVRVKG